MSDNLLQYLGYFWQGAKVTIWISWLALLLACVIGTLVATANLSKYRALRIFAKVYIEFFRSMPILVLLFVCYYGLPLIVGIEVSAFTAVTLGLGLTTSAAVAVVVQAGIASVDHGQREAGVALGLSPFQLWSKVILPQALRVIVPPSVGIYISALKDSSLGAVIGYVELTKTGLLIRDATGDNVSIIVAVASIYFLINFLISRLGAFLEYRMRIPGFSRS
ncbi:polar amino acid transport system permease protein [Gibbsiella quercinecans]|uniref:ABC transmembrane type-1 domain-containing protein n=1 Tax=Gibbsiella quercinecans TaxID=929813 RepID=A0A250B6J4_9GAMM|nr:amino acid ABC transporter permease [Gibbsiella quercinecans]ATA21715.1 hypothetical protein AWC35_21560 [Gibbsiella quercinecans]RLM02555.1 hypothetical protein BIY31_23410 [Gibbsiella quercinecans]RLM03750.1 hypothetical protein BIY30_21480 [Gibbsiella quercinecans]TCT88979.1 polar amino acid transport system permease protein [Gibbsiella quercinecans]